MGQTKVAPAAPAAPAAVAAAAAGTSAPGPVIFGGDGGDGGGAGGGGGGSDWSGGGGGGGVHPDNENGGGGGKGGDARNESGAYPDPSDPGNGGAGGAVTGQSPLGGAGGKARTSSGDNADGAATGGGGGGTLTIYGGDGGAVADNKGTGPLTGLGGRNGTLSGGGGGGGAANVLDREPTGDGKISFGDLTGGSGGVGAGGGGGGGGGVGLVNYRADTYTLESPNKISGGKGGDGGFDGGNGGGGGAGVFMVGADQYFSPGTASGGKLSIESTIKGGDGGNGGTNAAGGTSGNGGKGGAGVLGYNAEIVNSNSGDITGGMGGIGLKSGTGGEGVWLASTLSGCSKDNPCSSLTNSGSGKIKGGYGGNYDDDQTKSAFANGAGGVGVRMDGDVNKLTNEGAINGGDAGYNNSTNAADGGAGVRMEGDNSSLTNDNALATISGGSGGSGGNKGDGVIMIGNGNTVTNEGTISGGIGVSIKGSRNTLTNNWHITGEDNEEKSFAVVINGKNNKFTNTGEIGNISGVSILDDGTGISNNTLINEGAITLAAGGKRTSATAVTIADSGGSTLINEGVISAGEGSLATAVLIAGSGGSTLELHAGSVITGPVMSRSDNNTLRLGGDITNNTTNFAINEVTSDTSGTDTRQYSGFAHYEKSGASTWTLTGADGNGTSWTITAGTLKGSAESFGADQIVNPADPGVPANIEFEQNTDGVYGRKISGAGNLIKSGTGTLTLSGANIYSGGTTINAGTLQVGDGTSGSLGSNGNYAGNISNAGVLIFNQSNNQTLSGELSGSGSLSKQGAGILSLSEKNTYTGGTTVSGGLINFASLDNLGTGKITLNGGGLQWAANNAADVSGRLAALGPGGATFDTNGNNVIFYSGLSGAGALTKEGAGKLTLAAGLNRSLGPVAAGDVTVNAGALEIDGVGNYAKNVTLNNAGTLDFTTGDALVLSAASLTFNGTNGLNIAGTAADGTTILHTTAVVAGFDPAKVRIGNSATSVDYSSLSTRLSADGKDILIDTALTWNMTDGTQHGSFTLTNAGDTFTVDQVLADKSANAATAWDGKSLTKAGDGTLILTKDNTYTGTTTISAGTLQIGDGGTAGSIDATSGVNIADGATLAFNRSDDIAYNGGAIHGDGGLLKQGGGSLLLNGANTYTGLTTVEGGTLILGNDLTRSSGLVLYSDTGFDLNGHTHDLNGAGKTLTAFENATYYGDLSAIGANLNFISAGDPSATILTVTGKADIDGAKVNLGRSVGSQEPATGTVFHLLKADGGLDGTVSQGDGSGILRVGSLLVSHVAFSNTGTELQGIVTGTEATGQAKALSEGYLGGMALTLQGADVAAGQGMDAARLAARSDKGQGYGITGFGTVSAGSMRYHTGSHVDMNSISLLTGLALGTDTRLGRLTAAVFFEYGNGSYDTHNSFSSEATVNGDGDTWYMGGGLLGRIDFQDTGPGHIYLEASGRVGGIHNDYGSSDLRDANGRRADYDSSSAYYGLHVGSGYIWEINDKASLDLHGKYFWTRQEGDSASVYEGARAHFDDVDSQRLRAGSRFSYILNDYVAPYVGAAWEYEFDGKAKAKVNDHSVDAPSIKGGTGIGELGLAIKPCAALPLSFDVGVQGYTGQREGVTGSLRMKWEF